MAFCVECGHQLVEGAKFCFNCGKQVSQTTNTQPKKVDSDSISNKPNASNVKQFTLFDNNIWFSEELVSVIKLRKIFSENAWDKVLDFDELYDSKIQTLDDLLEVGLAKFISSIKESVELGVKVLMEYGIDYIDNDRLTDLASKHIDADKVWEPIFLVAKKIEEEAEKIARERNYQRASRSSWQGGGFGLGGAIKGAITAGAMNMATGALRGIGDSFTNSSDRAKIRQMKKDVIDDTDTAEILVDGLYHCCIGVFYSVYEVLRDEEIIVYKFADMGNLNAKLNNYLELLQKNQLEIPKLVALLCECIQKNPFNSKYYLELHKLNLPNRKDILTVVTYVGIQGEYQDKRYDLDEDRISHIDKNMPGSTIEQLKNKIASLEEIKQENDDVEIQDYIEKYNKKIKELEHKANEEKKIQDTLSLLSKSKVEIDEAINNKKFDLVWERISEGDVYAEYALDAYYCNTCESFYDKHNDSSANELVKPLWGMAELGNIFAEFIYYHAQQSRDGWDYMCAVDIHKLPEINITIKTTKALWGVREREYRRCSKEEGVKCIIECAEKYQPTAMAWLGSFYRTGRAGLDVDKDKANYYLTVAAELGHPYAKNELEKLKNGGSSSSLCYITTAVCKSFGKPDNCYELQTFRNFRDNWLRLQTDGEKLIQEYYITAPKIIKAIDQRKDAPKIYRNIWDAYLGKCLMHLEKKEYDRCKNIYVEMVKNMVDTYC